MDLKLVGKITQCVGGLYTVRVSDGEGDLIREIACRARGSFRHNNCSPLVGDVVELDTAAGEYNAVIAEIIDRKNSLIRPPMANLDCVFVVMAAAKPAPMPDMTDKLTSILEHNGIEPIIVIGKCELDEKRAEELRVTYASVGYKTFVISCATGEGIEELSRFVSGYISGKTAAMAGASGVGKSTLLNKLFPSLDLGTGSVSRKTERGKHTTRAVTLYPVAGDGYFADTPGFSMLDFERFDFFELDDLPLTFPEIESRIGQCKYTKCTHLREQGCAIVDAVKSGEIAKSRHDSYVELFEILKNKHKWDK